MNVTVRLVCRCISVNRRIWNNNVDAFFAFIGMIADA